MIRLKTKSGNLQRVLKTQELKHHRYEYDKDVE